MIGQAFDQSALLDADANGEQDGEERRDRQPPPRPAQHDTPRKNSITPLYRGWRWWRGTPMPRPLQLACRSEQQRADRDDQYGVLQKEICDHARVPSPTA